jgi:hypothetical protein
MTQIELMLLFKGNKTYCNDVFCNFRSVKYKLICERFKISQSDCDELEKIWQKSK